jgi:hypothetical protein
MQGTKFDIDDQHAGSPLRANDVPRHFQRIDRRIAAHEADDAALDRWRELASLDPREIDAGSGKAGAACDEKMGDVGALVVPKQPFDRLLRQDRGVSLEAQHALLGAREGAAAIERLAGVGSFERQFVARKEKRCSSPARFAMRRKSSSLPRSACSSEAMKS